MRVHIVSSATALSAVGVLLTLLGGLLRGQDRAP